MVKIVSDLMASQSLCKNNQSFNKLPGHPISINDI